MIIEREPAWLLKGTINLNDPLQLFPLQNLVLVLQAHGKFKFQCEPVFSKLSKDWTKEGLK
jgi:hypothetical protein